MTSPSPSLSQALRAERPPAIIRNRQKLLLLLLQTHKRKLHLV
jgi:hypothetical protein